jgi:hypothetical protein
MKRVKTKFLLHLWQSSDILIFSLVLQLWPLLTRTPLNYRTILTVAGLWMVARFFGAAQEVEGRSSAAPPEKETREFVDDPDAVLEISKLTGYDAIQRMNPYRGKWMTISGKFEGMVESLQMDAIHVSLLLNDRRRINLRFRMEQGEKLRGLREGQHIIAACRIPQFGLGFTPENCEVVRVERPRLAYAS